MIEWRVEKRKLKDLKQLPNNPRRISDKAFKKLKQRLHERGFRDVLKIDKENYVLSGNQWLKAMMEEWGDDYEVDVKVPACSTFSTAGNREGDWNKEKHFREGQAKQILSELFFDFLRLVEKLKPKVVIAENVSGIIKGNAKGYTKAVVEEFMAMGYSIQVFQLNAASMGVPQRRERVFFIANRLDRRIKLEFNQEPIPYEEIGDNSDNSNTLTNRLKECWRKANAGSFPLDYDFMDIEPKYLIGMSVPPVMMANVAYEIYNQLLK